MGNSLNTEESWKNHHEELVHCTRCPRLVAWREEVGRQKRRAYQHETYWSKPVPGFGDKQARVLVVGLAPGAHGSNRTGRMFTGDASGEFLFPALYRGGFASQPLAKSRQDHLELSDLFITAVCRCAPPQNKPSAEEIKNCLPYLQTEMHLLSQIQGIVCLGKISFDQTLGMLLPEAAQRKSYSFKHLAFYPAGELPYWILASYHPSRQNTQTGRLTEEMFANVWTRVRLLLQQSPS